MSLRKDRAARSEWDVAMLLPGVRVPLVREDLQRPDEPRAGFARKDDLVNVAASGSDIRVRELRLVLGHETRPFSGAILRSRDRILEDDIDRALRAHDCDLGGGPREVHVAADVLAAHDVVRAAIC